MKFSKRNSSTFTKLLKFSKRNSPTFTKLQKFSKRDIYHKLSIFYNFIFALLKDKIEIIQAVLFFLNTKINNNMSFLSSLFGGPSTSPAEIQELIKSGAVIIDVRTEQEYAQGNIKGALNIPVQVIGQFTDKIKQYNKPVVLYCRSGGRAGTAVNILAKAGIKAYNAGGLSDIQRLV